MSSANEMMTSFSIRKNPENIWGSVTDPTHSIRSPVSPKDAAKSEFYKDMKASNSLLSNVEARRRAQVQPEDNSTVFQGDVLSPNRKTVPKESVILNFQQEYLRHKRVVCNMNKLRDLYFDMDLHYRKWPNI